MNINNYYSLITIANTFLMFVAKHFSFFSEIQYYIIICVQVYCCTVIYTRVDLGTLRARLTSLSIHMRVRGYGMGEIYVQGWTLDILERYIGRRE